MKTVQIMLALTPIPFLFHLYEYHSYLLRQEPIFLFPVSIIYTIIIGVQLKEFKWPVILGISVFITTLSFISGYVFIPDEGSWFKPFGRDVVILLTSVVYILILLAIRWFALDFSTRKNN